jgi:acyl dehydratase
MRIISNLKELHGLVAQEIAVSGWLSVDQQRINDFAGATNDRQWIHVDAERARRESPFRTPIAQGFLTLSLLPYFLYETVRIEGIRMLVNYGLDRVRFPAPVPAGARLRGRLTVASVEDIAGGTQIEWQVTVDIEHQTKPACVAALLIRCYV